MPPLTRFLVFYAMLYAAFGLMSPFLPEFLRQRGLSATAIGTLLAAGTAARLVAGPLAGRVADACRAWRAVLGACAAAAAIAALLYLPARGFEILLLVGLAQAAAWAPLVPVADALAVVASRDQAGRFEYGWVRGTGSAAFILGVVASGDAIDRLGMDVMIWGSAALLALSAVLAALLPNIAVESDPEARSPQAGAIRSLLGMSAYRGLLLVTALVLGSHALHDTFAIISWRDAGISSAATGVLWSEQVVSEVAVFFLLGPMLLHRIGPVRALALAAAAGVLRWIVLGATADVLAVGLVEPLHGLTFALLHLAAMQLIGASVPRDLAATAQALYGTVAAGASVALLTFASGALYGAIGRAGFWVMALLCAAAIPLALRLSRSPPLR